MFEYGNSDNKQGYWIYDHLVLQMKDCLDCLKVMYPYFYFVFLFDHSFGNERAREGRLKESIMRKYLGEKQPNMRDTDILGEDEFLGPYDRILETYDIQHMWWDAALPDIQLTGPFWISDMKNAEHRYDVFIGKTKPCKLRKMSLLTACIVQEWGQRYIRLTLLEGQKKIT